MFVLPYYVVREWGHSDLWKSENPMGIVLQPSCWQLVIISYKNSRGWHAQFFLGPQSQFRNLKETLPQSQCRNFLKKCWSPTAIQQSYFFRISQLQVRNFWGWHFRDIFKYDSPQLQHAIEIKNWWSWFLIRQSSIITGRQADGQTNKTDGHLVKHTGGQIGRQAAERLAGRLVSCRKTGRWTERQAGEQTGRRMDRQTGRRIDGQTDWQVDRRTDRPIGGQIGRQTDRQIAR
jgi:hypothetical protein